MTAFGAANSRHWLIPLLTENVTLKEGLSATVNIITQQKDNVLYIPSKALTRQGATYTVKLLDGTTRTVKTGMTDGTNTEITEGLTEGDKVTYTTSTAKSTTTSSNPGGMMGGAPPGRFLI